MAQARRDLLMLHDSTVARIDLLHGNLVCEARHGAEQLECQLHGPDGRQQHKGLTVETDGHSRMMVAMRISKVHSILRCALRGLQRLGAATELGQRFLQERRAIRFIPKQLEAEVSAHTLELSFWLPKGSFATALFNELGNLQEAHARAAS